MEPFSNFLFPTLWIGAPLWLTFLFFIFKKKQAQPSPWGFLFEIKEGSPSSAPKIHKLYLLLYAITGLLLLFALSFPYHRTFYLKVSEPNLLKTLSPQEQEHFENRLANRLSQATHYAIHSPLGSKIIQAETLKSLFQEDFSQSRHSEFKDHPSYDLNLSLYSNTDSNFLFQNSSALNSSGIHGMRAKGSELEVAIWTTSPTSNMSLSFGQEHLPLKKNNWQYATLPLKALNEKLTLEPLDAYPIDNHLYIKGFELTTLNWVSHRDLAPVLQSTLQNTKLWTQHWPLSLTFDSQTSPPHQTKNLNFIESLLPQLSEVSQTSPSKHVYSTQNLAHSTRHHALKWPLIKRPELNVLQGQALWFYEDENYVTQSEEGYQIHSVLSYDSFKDPQNQAFLHLILEQLYPNSIDGWLIQRSAPSTQPVKTKTPEPLTKPIHTFPLGIALLLMMVALVMNFWLWRSRPKLG